MAKQLGTLTASDRMGDALMKALLRVGLAPQHMYLLTVPGRRTGKLYSTPVILVEDLGGRYLVAPYGERAWVKNARAAGAVQLSRGRARERLSITPLDPKGAARSCASTCVRRRRRGPTSMQHETRLSRSSRRKPTGILSFGSGRCRSPSDSQVPGDAKNGPDETARIP